MFLVTIFLKIMFHKPLFSICKYGLHFGMTTNFIKATIFKIQFLWVFSNILLECCEIPAEMKKYKRKLAEVNYAWRKEITKEGKEYHGLTWEKEKSLYDQGPPLTELSIMEVLLHEYVVLAILFSKYNCCISISSMQLARRMLIREQLLHRLYTLKQLTLSSLCHFQRYDLFLDLSQNMLCLFLILKYQPGQHLWIIRNKFKNTGMMNMPFFIIRKKNINRTLISSVMFSFLYTDFDGL